MMPCADELPPFFADLPANEASLLAAAMDWLKREQPSVLNAKTLSTLTHQGGLDFATSVLFCHTVTQPECHKLVTSIVELMKQEPDCPPVRATLAVAPGAFYRQVAKSGGDGRKVREHAETLGFRTELIPCQSMGTLAENASIIRQWLSERQREYPTERIVLVSLSKGAADIKTALLQEAETTAFSNVEAWINISGVPMGSPVVNWFQQRRLRWRLQHGLFALRGLDFEVVRQLEWGAAGHLHAELKLPPHMKMLTLVGFPLRQHGSHFILRSYRQKMKASGPSDGVALLTDVVSLPGDVVPIWGADHYMRPGWDVSRLIRATAIHIARELSLFAEA